MGHLRMENTVLQWYANPMLMSPVDIMVSLRAMLVAFDPSFMSLDVPDVWNMVEASPRHQLHLQEPAAS